MRKHAADGKRASNERRDERKSEGGKEAARKRREERAGVGCPWMGFRSSVVGPSRLSCLFVGIKHSPC